MPLDCHLWQDKPFGNMRPQMPFKSAKEVDNETSLIACLETISKRRHVKSYKKKDAKYNHFA